MLKLQHWDTNRLLAQPESGMGFQIVELTMTDRSTATGTVYNADLLLLDTEPKDRLLRETYDQLVRAAEDAGSRIHSVRVLPRRTADRGPRVMEDRSQTGQTSGPAKDAPTEKTSFGQMFKRFTAYENDHRVTSDRSLLPGTYATTAEDAQNVSSGRQAVARYALPNPAPASWVFTAIPDDETAIQRGIVEPAYGQPGGGVEVIFSEGTQRRTVTGPKKIPD
jgi:hypothetical protein